MIGWRYILHDFFEVLPTGRCNHYYNVMGLHLDEKKWPSNGYHQVLHAGCTGASIMALFNDFDSI